MSYDVFIRLGRIGFILDVSQASVYMTVCFCFAQGL